MLHHYPSLSLSGVVARVAPLGRTQVKARRWAGRALLLFPTAGVFADIRRTTRDEQRGRLFARAVFFAKRLVGQPGALAI